jgi:hypothetical protein
MRGVDKVREFGVRLVPSEVVSTPGLARTTLQRRPSRSAAYARMPLLRSQRNEVLRVL